MQLKRTVKNVQTRLAPFEAYSLLRGMGGESFLLESVEGTKKTARYSFIGVLPVFSFSMKGKTATYSGPAGEGTEKVEDPYAFLKQKFKDYSAEGADGLPFSGGIVGYFSYDTARLFERLPEKLPDDLKLPDARFILPGFVVSFDHLHKQTMLLSIGGDERDAKKIEGLLQEKAPVAGEVNAGKPKGNTSQKEFESAVEKAKAHIRDGDVFQVVPSRRLEFPYSGDETAIYAAMRDVNPSPYMFFLDFKETKIIGSSPEMLVRLDNGTLTTRPIAGTRPRSEDAEEDEKLKVSLLLDEKERAEHLMLVDLHRNDLGRVSEYGSVKVDSLMGTEKYSHVQHIVSNVTGRLRREFDAFDALKACFPAGTVTGAPKIRAMEIIEELEKCRRGPYGGVVGYFDFEGNADFAITIRSLFTKGAKAYLQAGAGVVADSLPEYEFLETENKMKALLEALKVQKQ